MKRRLWLAIAFAPILLVATGTPLLAQSPTPIPSPTGVPGPCPYNAVSIKDFGLQDFANPPDEHFTDGQQHALTVRYTDPNTTKLGGCNVTLRSYNGQLVGPTLRAKPGETLVFDLRNELPQQNTPIRDGLTEAQINILNEIDNAHLVMTPNSFNVTNLHTHGLHVSPEGNSDNVLVAIDPGQTHPYKIEIPKDHPPGTFWYHAHAHGSTAVQVGSGMAGALIIEDDLSKLPPALAEATKHEKVMVIGSILYDTNGKVEDIGAFFPDPQTGINPDCPKGLPTCTWQGSKRRTTINGQIVPKIHMQPGEVQRWRMIDATFRESLNIQLKGHSLHEIALDGLYLGRVDTWRPNQNVHLEAGYRSDVLVRAGSKKGTFLLIDAPTPATQGVRGVAEDTEILAELVVSGDPLDMKLPTNAEMAPLAPFGNTDLRKDAVGVQQVSFKIGSDMSNSPQNYFQINDHSFNEGQVRYLQLGATEAWALTTEGDPKGVPGPPSKGGIPPLPHIFHIHVNPFQTLRKDPQSHDELVWKDTVLVPAGANMLIYTKYTDFTGKFVIHCHILDHEDLGMMEVVDVVKDLPMPMQQQMMAHG
jgi:FtsP/CotA-like multicopper oxidase with cupredoxin domain